jgi:ACR3 family arsenite efflux pump ArsB
MLVLALLFAIGTAFIPMPRIVHTLLTFVIVAIAFLAMGVGGCAQYWDNHMRPGTNTGKDIVFGALLVIVARLIAMVFAKVTDNDEPPRRRLKR